MLLIFVVILLVLIVYLLGFFFGKRVARNKWQSKKKESELSLDVEEIYSQADEQLEGARAEEYKKLSKYLISLLSLRNSNDSSADILLDPKHNTSCDSGIQVEFDGTEISTPEESSWLNLIIVRYWMLLFRSKIFTDELRQRLTALISRRAGVSSIVNKISIFDISMGSGTPHVSEISIVKSTDKRLSVTLEANLKYSGGAYLSIDALAFGSYKFKGSVNLPEFSSKIRLCFPAPESDSCAAIAFVKYPKLDLIVNLSVPSPINNEIVRRTLGKILGYALRRALTEFLVLPNWYPIRLPLLVSRVRDYDPHATNIESKKVDPYYPNNIDAKKYKVKPLCPREGSPQLKLNSSSPRQDEALVEVNITVDNCLNVDLDTLQMAEDKIFNFICELLDLNLAEESAVLSNEANLENKMKKDELKRPNCSFTSNERVRITWRPMRRKCSILIQKLDIYKDLTTFHRLRRSVFILQHSSLSVFKVLSDIEHNFFVNECCRGITTLKRFGPKRSLVEFRYRSRSIMDEEDLRLLLMQFEFEFKIGSSDPLDLVRKVNSDVVRVLNDEPSYMILYSAVHREADSFVLKSDNNMSSANEISLDTLSPFNSDFNIDVEKFPQKRLSAEVTEVENQKARVPDLKDARDLRVAQNAYLKAYCIVPVIILDKSIEIKGSCLVEISSYSRELEFLNITLSSQKQLRDYIDSKCSVYDFPTGMLNHNACPIQSNTVVASPDNHNISVPNVLFSDVLDLYGTAGNFEHGKQKNQRDAVSKIPKKLMEKIKTSKLANLKVAKIARKLNRYSSNDTKSAVDANISGTLDITNIEGMRNNVKMHYLSSDGGVNTTERKYAHSLETPRQTIAPMDLEYTETLPDPVSHTHGTPEMDSFLSSDNGKMMISAVHQGKDLLCSPVDSDAPIDPPIKCADEVNTDEYKYLSLAMKRINPTLEVLDINLTSQDDSSELFVVWELYTSEGTAFTLSSCVVHSDAVEKVSLKSKHSKSDDDIKISLMLSETPILSPSYERLSLKGSVSLNVKCYKSNKIVFICESSHSILSHLPKVVNCWIYKGSAFIPYISEVPTPSGCYYVDDSKLSWIMNVIVPPYSSMDIILFVKKPRNTRKLILLTKSTSPLLLFSIKLLDTNDSQCIPSGSLKRKVLAILFDKTPDTSKGAEIKSMIRSVRLYAKKKFEKKQPYKANLGKVSDPHLPTDTYCPNEHPDSAPHIKCPSNVIQKNLQRRCSSPSLNNVVRVDTTSEENFHEDVVSHRKTSVKSMYARLVRSSREIAIVRPDEHLPMKLSRHDTDTNTTTTLSNAEIEIRASSYPDALQDTDQNTSNSCPSNSPLSPANRDILRSESLDADISYADRLINPKKHTDMPPGGDYCLHELTLACNEGYVRINIDNLVSQYNHNANLRICFCER